MSVIRANTDQSPSGSCSSIFISWFNAVCIPKYRIVVSNSTNNIVFDETIDECASFLYFPTVYGCYNFDVISIDYFGRNFTTNSTNYCFICEL